MVDLPAGFRVVTPPAAAAPALPAGFRVVTPSSTGEGLAALNALDASQGRPVPAAAPASPPVPTQTPYKETGLAQGLSGVNEGMAAVLGLPVDLTQGALRLGAAGLNTAAGTDIQLPVSAVGGSESIRSVMGPAIVPESADPGNQMIRRIGEEFGANIIPGMGVVSRAARPVQSAATQAAVTLGSGAGAAVADQVLPDNPFAELVGSILGGGTAAGLVAGAKKAVTPFEISPERQTANATMAREGIDLSAGQMTGSKGLQYAESELGGSAAANLTEQQAEQFTQAALARIGVSATRATPEVMRAADDAIGTQFDSLAARNTLVGDQQLGQDLGQAVQQYNSTVSPTNRAPIVESVLTDLVASIQANNGTLSGEAYKSVRSALSRASRNTMDPELRMTLRGITEALDGAMERSIAVYNPNDAGAWSEVRNDYRNFLVIENAMSRAGENTALGLLSPAALRSAVAQQGKRAYVQGQGDFADLARSGVATMSPLPQSGTAPRQFVRNAGMTMPAIMGAAFGGQSGDMLGAAVGAGAGALVPGALGKLLMSNTGRHYLTNQAWNGPLDMQQNLAAPAASSILRLLAASGT
jgi:hypothetical protein